MKEFKERKELTVKPASQMTDEELQAHVERIIKTQEASESPDEASQDPINDSTTDPGS